MDQVKLIKRECKTHNEKVLSLCLHPTCFECRLVCHDCLSKQLHVGHDLYLKKYKNYDQILIQTNQLCCNIFTKFNEIMDDIQNQLKQLEQRFQNKYCISIERINLITNDQLNLFISNMLQFENITEKMMKEMENYHQYFQKQFNQWLNELEVDESIITQKYFHYLKRVLVPVQISIKKYTQQDRQQKSQSIVLEGQLKIQDQFSKSIKRQSPAHTLRKGKNEQELGVILKKKDQDVQLTQDDDQSEDVWSLFKKGDDLRQSKQYSAAIGCFNQLLQRNPDDFQSLGAKGACLNALYRFQEAFECLTQAVELNPNYTFGINQLKICQEKLKL